MEIGHTDSTPGVNRFLTFFFLLVILAVPVAQNVVEVRDILGGRDAGRWVPQCWDVFGFLLPSASELKALAAARSGHAVFAALKSANNRMLRDIGQYEAALKDRDRLIQWLIPRMQVPISGWLKGGNEDVYVGRGGWLFYRRDLDSVTGPGFLEPQVLQRRAAAGSELKAPPQPDPVPAILAFHAQLAQRGITLVIVPAPGKAALEPERFSARYEGAKGPPLNACYAEFAERLRHGGVAVCDVTPALWAAKARLGRPLCLATDTHWTSEGMELAAAEVKVFLESHALLAAAANDSGYKQASETVTNLGDLAMMLKLPPGQTWFRPEQVTIHPVLTGRGEYWQPTANADVLVLGDSFSNIYSLEAMGWGAGAGFVEQLSMLLKRPVDRIVRNDAGAYATREMLVRELRRGRDRLAGKKVVVWEFAMRELANGDWKRLDLPTPEDVRALVARAASGGAFFSGLPDRSVEVVGTVESISAVPRPGSVPYKDHILALHLTELAAGDGTKLSGDQTVVYVWSMRDNRLTAVAHWRAGDRVRLRLVPWAAVAAKYEAINRSELAAEELQQEEPAWGEPSVP